jgi:DNA-binding LacI/PurR family transcriptional regulator
MSELGQNKPKIRTMEKLSATIGISRPTLSKFFQDADSVRSTTRKRIEDALDTVDYVPNFFATKMNRQSTRLIGVIVPYLSDLFYTTLIQAIEEAALESGYAIIVQNAHGDSELEAKAFENLLSMSADGVIAAPIGQSSALTTIERIQKDLPVVFVDSRVPGKFEQVDFVGTNNEQSIALMVDYLCRSGEPPVFLGMPRINSNSLERERAYVKSAKETGFAPAIIPLSQTDTVWNFEEFAYLTMDEYFSRGEYIDSTILCANDRLAIGVIRAANKHHLLPQRKEESTRFRVAGHDDHPLSAYVYPALTTVSRNTVHLGQTAVSQVLDQIKNGKRTDQGVVRTFNAELRLRESA